MRYALPLLAVLALPLPSAAQIFGTGVLPVTEVGPNLQQSTITAIQSVITAAQTTLIQANQILDLTKVTGLTTEDGLLEDIRLLCDMIAQAQNLQMDVVSIEAQIATMFDLSRAPSTRSALDERLAEIKQLKQQALIFAFRTQSLIRTLLRTGDHLKALFADLQKLIGNLSGQQRLAEVEQVQNKTLAVLAAQTAAWQRADTIDRGEVALVRESIALINAQRLADWPRD